MTDDQLLAALREGDEVAFTELVRRYQSSMVRIARLFVKSEPSAEDVVQDTWIAVIKGAERFEGRSSVKTWLFRILSNRARDVGTREQRSVPVDLNEEGPTVDARRFSKGGMWSEPPIPFTDLVDGRLSDARALRSIRHALAELPEPQQAVVTLRDVEGLSTMEVAELLGLSEGNVRVVLHRGRAKIRAAVETVLGGPS